MRTYVTTANAHGDMFIVYAGPDEEKAYSHQAKVDTVSFSVDIWVNGVVILSEDTAGVNVKHSNIHRALMDKDDGLHTLGELGLLTYFSVNSDHIAILIKGESHEHKIEWNDTSGCYQLIGQREGLRLPLGVYLTKEGIV